MHMHVRADRYSVHDSACLASPQCSAVQCSAVQCSAVQCSADGGPTRMQEGGWRGRDRNWFVNIKGSISFHFISFNS